MNVKVIYSCREEDCRELGNLVENLLRPVDAPTLEGLLLRVGKSKYSGPAAALVAFRTYLSIDLVTFVISATQKGEMRVNYASRTKMDRIHFNYVTVSLLVPGSVERIQDMVRKAVKVFIKWTTKPKRKPTPEKVKSAKKKQRFAYRMR